MISRLGIGYGFLLHRSLMFFDIIVHIKTLNSYGKVPIIECLVKSEKY
jgi:hypothetical protein